MSAARLQEQLSFIMEAEGLKQIFRQTVLPADGRADGRPDIGPTLPGRRRADFDPTSDPTSGSTSK